MREFLLKNDKNSNVVFYFTISSSFFLCFFFFLSTKILFSLFQVPTTFYLLQYYSFNISFPINLLHNTNNSKLSNFFCKSHPKILLYVKRFKRRQIINQLSPTLKIKNIKKQLVTIIKVNLGKKLLTYILSCLEILVQLHMKLLMALSKLLISLAIHHLHNDQQHHQSVQLFLVSTSIQIHLKLPLIITE